MLLVLALADCWWSVISLFHTSLVVLTAYTQMPGTCTQFTSGLLRFQSLWNGCVLAAPLKSQVPTRKPGTVDEKCA
jgi:hypothetical protein